MRGAALCLLLPGCLWWINAGSSRTDDDGDGFTANLDCDDGDASVFPGATEVCGDGAVNDCDGDEATAAEACGVGGTWTLGDICETGRLRGAKVEMTLGEGFGISIAGLGDVTGDAIGDMLVGMRAAGSGGEGGVFLVRGPLDCGQGSADLLLITDNPDTRLGEAVALLGDIDGDGDPDLGLGAPGTSGGLGAVTVMLTAGSNIGAWRANPIFPDSARAEFGGAMVGLGRQPGDDGDSFAIAAPGDEGRAYLFRGFEDVISVNDASLTLTCTDGEGLGADMANGGDPEGDGGATLLLTGACPDAAVYGVSALGVGTVEAEDSDIVLDASALTSIADVSLAGATDLNDDGTDDIIVGAPTWEDNGAALIFYGWGAGSAPAALTDYDAIVRGGAEGDLAGWALAAPGDFDGDGEADLALGAPGASAASVGDSGAVYVFSGPILGEQSTADARLTLGGPEANALLELALTTGDVNGDTIPDLGIGAPIGAGTLYTILGGGF